MTQQRTRSDRALSCEVAGWQLPRFHDRVDVVVECEATVLHRLENGHRAQRLADRGGLKERVRVNAGAGDDVGETVTLRPMNAEIFDDGDADARNMVLVHDLRQRERRKLAEVSRLRTFDPCDESGDRVVCADDGDGNSDETNSRKKPSQHRFLQADRNIYIRFEGDERSTRARDRI